MNLNPSIQTNVLGLGGIGSVPPTLIIPESNAQGYFSLWAGSFSTLTPGNFYPFYKNGVAYQVTAGKTCKVVAFAVTGTATGGMQLVTATASFAFNAASLTGGVFQGGASGQYCVIIGLSNTQFPYSYSFDFAASTFPGFQDDVSGGVAVQAICKEI